MEFLHFLFSSFWVFCGMCLLMSSGIALLAETIVYIIKACKK